MKLNIYNETGKRCITQEKGQKIFDIIHPVLLSGESVTLDFKGVTQYASPFFNYAIGQLLKDIKIDDLKKNLIIENLDEDGHFVIERVIENASKYKADINYQKIVDSILQQPIEEEE